MKIEKEVLQDHQVKITAEIDPETFETFKRRAARKISKDYKMPGFRPGKAPFEVVRRNFGDDAIQKQAIELLVDDIYPKVLDESEIKPSGPGQLENVTSMDPP
ncbi:MAG: trigger factor family protein, partial [Anaerolineaceae bacterium]|nr:trigger factor family protein [Anaerolineaceae bacterium]